jgi:hypothetical protein
MRKQSQNQGKKVLMLDDMERMKIRREERKKTQDEKSERKNDDNGKACDAYYENLLKKKKLAFNIEPNRVFIIINLISCLKIIYSFLK